MSFRHEVRAEVIADSLSPEGTRITTMEITFHRFVLAEFNTHRKFSRNSASSRAIPVETMLQRVIEHTAFPTSWPREQRGMSGGDQLTGDDIADAMNVLHDIRQATTKLISDYVARHPDKSTRLHKSILNRPLEWLMWHTAIVTSTEWENFFHQRISPTAQPEINALAEQMKEAYEESTPNILRHGDMHLPYTSPEERSSMPLIDLVKLSTARCARVSYLTHDGVRNPSEDARMFDETLWAHGHWSPMEHPALCVPPDFPASPSNFDIGWAQVRGFAELDSLHLIEPMSTTMKVVAGVPVSDKELKRSAAVLSAMVETDEEREALASLEVRGS